jgi:Coenzyme PQQ synthesis protein D (PqqD)
MRISPRDGVVFRATRSGGLLIDMETGACFQLNRVAAEIWALSMEGNTIAKIVEAICQKYGIPEEVAEADVGAVCTEIRRAGLANPTPPPEAPIDASR